MDDLQKELEGIMYAWSRYMAKVRYIETHITDLVKRKQTYTNIKRIDCIKVEKG